VAGDDAVILVDQNRVVKAEGLDAGGDLGDLLRRMRPRVSAVRPQLCRRLENELEVCQGQAPGKEESA
jgi:hypothetical protein